MITGLRRSGKSVLLFHLYRDYLISNGVPQEQIIGLALDILPNAKYRNPMELDKHIREQITDSGKRYYVFIDEIQFVSEIQNPYVDDPEAKITFLGYFADTFLIRRAVRYDVKRRKYIKTPAKYYYSDPGLRNARLGFRQLEETHLMENVLYNDLIRRDLDVDVGVVEYNTTDQEGKKIRKQMEVDFVVNKGSDRYYIQSALSISETEKKEQEIASLLRIPDSFRKIVVVKDYLKPWTDEHGIQYIGIEQFLLDEDLLK